MDAVRAAVAQGVFQDLGAQYAQQLEASQAQEELYAGQIAALHR